jgi:putative DNA primase/helicase
MPKLPNTIIRFPAQQAMRRDDDASGFQPARPVVIGESEAEFREGLARVAARPETEPWRRDIIVSMLARRSGPEEPEPVWSPTPAEIEDIVAGFAAWRGIPVPKIVRVTASAGPARYDDSKKGDDEGEKVVRLEPKQKPQPEPPWDQGAPPPEPLPSLGPTDDQIGDVFADEHRDDLRYVAAWGRWYEWRDGCWRQDERLNVLSLIRRTCKVQGIERASMSRMVGAVHSLVRADPRIAATIEQWDTDPMLLNTPDGVVNLRTGKVLPHRPSDHMTMIAAVGPRGDCLKWKAFLSQITKGDAALIAYLQRIAGYCLTGDTGEQAMFFGYGVGANGKGVFLQTIGRVLGDYCKTAAIETFTESKTDRHPTELARLHSARLVTATETESGRCWAESRIKMLTGGDTVTAHFMRQDDFEYVPKFKLFFTGNHKPGLRSVGEAMRRRMHMIPFAVIIPKDKRDPHFVDRLKDEWPGILQWMIDGCLEWHEHGLAPPEVVTKETDAYFETQDSFSQWIEERCDRDPNAWTTTTQLFASWKAWAEKAGVRYGDIKSFGEAMGKKTDFVWKRTGFGRGYQGLRIKLEAPPRWHDDG